ncbi:CatB-related O-acetyltransferase [Paraburkholderia ginsengisoli]|uniref:CatB-related O-acetyltransferase n=1 Tax=Paraburkholderia ginsengisoli TaxID=311231 RepID=A0A7T4N5Z0_9BURK|nr:CatB-related O-acetyltransferase [Paraburkholderia ginsengisoli]QQC65847.1 CatB-related O-acetyltransferase [Paraburkholderia ginsengisoli]
MEVIHLHNEIRERFERCNIALDPKQNILKWEGLIELEEFSSVKNDHLVTCGAFSYSFSHLPFDTKVGRYCSIAYGITDLGNSHPLHFVSGHPFLFDGGDWREIARRNGSDWDVHIPYDDRYGPIEIGHDCWIGSGARIKGGVKIGTGSVIAAGAIVTKDVPPYSMVAGVPAKVVKNRFSDKVIELLLETEWWNYAYWDLKGLPFDEPERFANEFLDIKSRLKPFEPRVFGVRDILRA